jgi:hypothetical protein
MAIAPLDQRLGSILPQTQDPAAAAPDIQLEPMPGADQPIEPPESTDQAGTPSMADGVQVAGPAGAIGDMLRATLKKAGTKAERNLVPDAARAAEGELPDATKAGRFKIIPEADQTLTDKVTDAVSARKAAGGNIGKPSPTQAELDAGVPVEPFNLSVYKTEDASAVIGGVADALGIKTKAVTFDEIKAKAAESGISENFMSRLIGSDGKMMANAVETYKALEVLESSANELDSLFKLVDSGNATDVDKLKLRQQIAFHGLIQKGVKGMQTETARALAVFRIPREGNAAAVRQVLDDFGGDAALQDMAKSYLTLETRAAKNAMVEKSMMTGVKDVWFTTYINGLLSSPVSHAKNIVGNSMMGLYQIPERMVAAFYSNTLPQGVRSWKALVPGSEKDKIEFDEALTMVQSLRNGIAEGLELASTAWKNNQPNDLMSKIELQRGNATPPISSAAMGVEPDKWLGKAIDFYGSAVTVPGRALMTEDEFFKGVMYRMELNTQITRRAKSVYRDAVENGVPEADALAKAEAEAVSLFQNPPGDLDEAATAFAQNGTFTSELPEGLKRVQQVFNHPALKVVVPFFKTPANIGLNVVERTPFAPLSSRWRDEMAKGGVYRDMALAKVTLGSAMLATFGAIAAEGTLTGRGPERKADKEALMRDGWQPYSIKVGDKYYSYSGMEPISAFLAIAADYAEYAQNEPDASNVEQVFLGATYGLYEYLKEQPYLQGIADVAKLIGTNQQGAVDGKKIVDGLAKQFGGFAIGGSPAGAYSSAVASIDRLLDPTNKDTRANPDLPMGVRGFVEAFNKYRSRLPYFSESVPESLNLWGEPVMRSRGNPLELVMPTKVSPQQFSEVDDALWRIGSPVGMPDRKVDGVEMTAVQYNRLLSIYGKETTAKTSILEVMQSPGFALLNLDDQQKTVQQVHSKYMDMAKMKLKAEFPDLSAKIGELDELRKANGLYYKPD